MTIWGVYTPKMVGYIRNRPMHAQSVPMDAFVPAMALAQGAPPSSPTATQSASRVGDMSTHAQSMPNEMWERVHTYDHH